MIRLLIADDHQIIREGLKMILSGAEDISFLTIGGMGEAAAVLRSRGPTGMRRPPGITSSGSGSEHPHKIVVFGRSLGGAVAVWASQAHKPRVLILESTFTSLREAARDRLPGLFVKFFVPDQYRTLQYLTMVHCPVLILHSRDDEIIPFRHGEALYAAANGPKEFVEIRGSHNRGFLDSQPLYEAALDSFLSKYLGKK